MSDRERKPMNSPVRASAPTPRTVRDQPFRLERAVPDRSHLEQRDPPTRKRD